jgi:hypothetical protein
VNIDLFVYLVTTNFYRVEGKYFNATIKTFSMVKAGTKAAGVAYPEPDFVI